MKQGIAKTLKFAGGSAFGAALGAAIGALMAPRSGDETQAQANALVTTMKTEGEVARIEAEERVARNFRAKVDDPNALKNA